jgi:hypothetical protein
MKMVKNIIGRFIPEESDGRKNIPFKGIGQYKPVGHKVGPPIPSNADYGNKVVEILMQL